MIWSDVCHIPFVVLWTHISMISENRHQTFDTHWSRVVYEVTLVSLATQNLLAQDSHSPQVAVQNRKCRNSGMVGCWVSTWSTPVQRSLAWWRMQTPQKAASLEVSWHFCRFGRCHSFRVSIACSDNQKRRQFYKCLRERQTGSRQRYAGWSTRISFSLWSQIQAIQSFDPHYTR